MPGKQRTDSTPLVHSEESIGPRDIRAVIAGKRPFPKLDAPAPAVPRHIELIVNIWKRLRSREDSDHERWAKVYNLKQMAAALQFMQEHQSSEYSRLTIGAEAASARFHALTEQFRQTQTDLAYTSL